MTQIAAILTGKMNVTLVFMKNAVFSPKIGDNRRIL
jgi:hypothetical protein